MPNEIEGYISAKEAAKKLGYSYAHFMELLREGKVEGAEYWQGYLIPKNISQQDVKVQRHMRPLLKEPTAPEEG